MLGKKLVVIAAAVTVAISSLTITVAGKEQNTHVRIHIHPHRAITNHPTPSPTTSGNEDNVTWNTTATSRPTPAPTNGGSEIKNETNDWQPTQAFLYERDELFCPRGWSNVQVLDIDGVYCVEGSSKCNGSTSGQCPQATEGLPYGSHCEQDENGLYVCVANTHDCEDKDESPMSVEGIPGVFCVQGPACVADTADGACPGPQVGLPWGSSCGIVKTGIYGCQANPIGFGDESDDKEEEENSTPVCKGSPMSVEGVPGVFCVVGSACVADFADGACPGPQKGLEYGSSCGKVKTGVYGCQANTKPPAGSEGGEEDSDYMTNDSKEEEEEKDSGEDGGVLCSGKDESPMSIEGVEGVFCVTGRPCVAQSNGACPSPQKGLEYGAYCGTVKTGVFGCKPILLSQDTGEDSNDNEAGEWLEEEEATGSDNSEEEESDETIVVDIQVCDGEDESPISVEGVEGWFCVSGQACVADRNGQCPVPQEGLEYGAYCGTVKTGVFGCLPITPSDEEGGEADEVVRTPVPMEDSDEQEGLCSGEDESPMSVEGVEGVFCVTGQVCVAQIHGTCPGPQKGLKWGSSCNIIKTGVYGCQPNTADSEDEEEATVPIAKAPLTPSPGTEDSEEEESEETMVVDIQVCDGEDESPISVEGVEGWFCVSGQACVADRNGQCPVPQEGLEYGAYCGTVKSGVLGCLPIAANTMTLVDDQTGSTTDEDTAEDEIFSRSQSMSDNGSSNGSVETYSSSGSVDAESSSASGSVEVYSSSASGSVGAYGSSASGSVEVGSFSSSGSVGVYSSSASGSLEAGDSASTSSSGSVEGYSSSDSGSVETYSSSASGSVGSYSSSASGRVEVGSSSTSGSAEIYSSSSSGSVEVYSSSSSGSVEASASSSSSGSVESYISSTSSSSISSDSEEVDSSSLSTIKKHHHHKFHHHKKPTVKRHHRKQ